MTRFGPDWMCCECGATAPADTLADRPRHQCYELPPAKARSLPWHLDTRTQAQRRRAVKRWHGHGSDEAVRWQDHRVRIAAYFAYIGVTRSVIACALRVTPGRITQMGWEWYARNDARLPTLPDTATLPGKLQCLVARLLKRIGTSVRRVSAGLLTKGKPVDPDDLTSDMLLAIMGLWYMIDDLAGNPALTTKRKDRL